MISAPNYQYPEDIPHVSGDIGTAALTLRKDLPASSVSADGDYALLSTDELGRLRINSARLRNPSSVYFVTERFSLLTIAHLANTGFMWLINPLISTKLLNLKHVSFTPMPGSSASMNSAPRIRMERVGFTGVAAGLVLLPSTRDTTEPLNSGLALSTAVGLTLVPNNPVTTFVPHWSNSLSTVYPVDQVWHMEDNHGLILRPGEGIVLRQHDAGSSPETRTFHTDMIWEEISL